MSLHRAHVGSVDHAVTVHVRPEVLVVQRDEQTPLDPAHVRDIHDSIGGDISAKHADMDVIPASEVRGHVWLASSEGSLLAWDLAVGMMPMIAMARWPMDQPGERGRASDRASRGMGSGSKGERAPGIRPAPMLPKRRTAVMEQNDPSRPFPLFRAAFIRGAGAVAISDEAAGNVS